MFKHDFYIARNKEIREWIIEVIRNYRLPFKIYIQPIFPGKTPNQLAYLFGVVIARISEHTGHAAIEVYEGYKEKFNLEYSEDDKGRWRLRSKGASEMTTIDLLEFALKIRADAVIELGINIELPNEVWIDELDFAEEKRLSSPRSTEVIQRKIPRISFKVRNYKKW